MVILTSLHIKMALLLGNCWTASGILNIMILNFLDREEEVKKVEEKYGSDKSEFVLIYGRRRIGKTELIKKFIEEKKAFYFLCEKNKIEVESERFLERFNRNFDVFIEARNLEDFFEKISTRFKNERIIVAIDFTSG